MGGETVIGSMRPSANITALRLVIDGRDELGWWRSVVYLTTLTGKPPPKVSGIGGFRCRGSA
jgi:hypothetical protein